MGATLSKEERTLLLTRSFEKWKKKNLASRLSRAFLPARERKPTIVDASLSSPPFSFLFASNTAKELPW